MQQIIPTRKSYHDWRGRPSLIKITNRQPTGGWNVPMSNNGGGPFNGGNNKPPRGGKSGHLVAQK